MVLLLGESAMMKTYQVMYKSHQTMKIQVVQSNVPTTTISSNSTSFLGVFL